MKITYILLATFSLSILMMISFFISTLIINKKNNKNIDIRNVFPFEARLTNQYKSINVFLFISFISTLGGAILFASKYLDVLPIILVVAVLLLLFSTAAIFYIDLRHLKEHLYISLAIVALYFLAVGFLTYLSHSICKLFDYQNITGIISLVISALLLLLALFFIINPKIFDLKMNVDEKGNESRPKYFHLAFTEWVISLSIPLLQLPLILLASIL